MVQKLEVQYVRYYTPGSAAQKIMPAFPAQNEPVLPRVHKRKIQKIYVDPVAVLGIAVAVCMLICMIVGVFQLKQAHQQTVIMEQYVQKLSEKNAQLNEEYSQSYNLQEVEDIALAMGMVPQQEITRISVSVQTPAQEAPAQISLWQRVGTFLTGLFA